jgi:hypothetical protein
VKRTGLKATVDAINSANNPLWNLSISSSSSSGVPSGYIAVDLNEGAGGKYIYLSCTFAPSTYWLDPLVNYISVEITSIYRSIRYQTGYEYVTYVGAFSTIPADCNDGAGGKYVYIKMSKALDQYSSHQFDAPIRQIRIVSSTSSSVTQTGWTKVNSDLNSGCGGKYIYLFYKQ